MQGSSVIFTEGECFNGSHFNTDFGIKLLLNAENTSTEVLLTYALDVWEDHKC